MSKEEATTEGAGGSRPPLTSDDIRKLKKAFEEQRMPIDFNPKEHINHAAPMGKYKNPLPPEIAKKATPLNLQDFNDWTE